jgi:hypothetical protein
MPAIPYLNCHRCILERRFEVSLLNPLPARPVNNLIVLLDIGFHQGFKMHLKVGQ